MIWIPVSSSDRRRLDLRFSALYSMSLVNLSHTHIPSEKEANLAFRRRTSRTPPAVYGSAPQALTNESHALTRVGEHRSFIIHGFGNRVDTYHVVSIVQCTCQPVSRKHRTKPDRPRSRPWSGPTPLATCAKRRKKCSVQVLPAHARSPLSGPSGPRGFKSKNGEVGILTARPIRSPHLQDRE